MAPTASPRDFTFSYDLPKRLIAQEPLRNRSDARLMLVNRREQRIDHHHVRDLPELLPSGDRLVFNNTKVVPATLQGVRTATGGRWQGLFLASGPDGRWKIVCKTRGRLHAGEVITLLDREMRPSTKIRLIERIEDGQWIAVADGDKPLSIELLESIGRVPLPHYIRGGRMVDSDVQNYQTVYARHPGAVAAPTAGLHFTKRLLSAVEQVGVQFSAVTLHVGLGTFRPVQTDNIDDHNMHAEWCQLSETTAREINETRAAGGRIVAVGTTVVRVLESVGALPGASVDGITSLIPWEGETDLFIRPPYEFRAVDALLTNFHFPRTTLLVLVQTFAGYELLREAYEEAVREEYRFYSYGDAMLIV